jgi:hypothetical protein
MQAALGFNCDIGLETQVSDHFHLPDQQHRPLNNGKDDALVGLAATSNVCLAAALGLACEAHEALCL